MKAPKYLTKLNQMPELTAAQQEELNPVSEKFAFRSNEYYQSLIDWADPNDPIRRIVVPSIDEMINWGRLDASDEGRYTVVSGLEHKYTDIALLLVNDVCGAYCRFCFRKRLFMDNNDEVARDVSQGLAYVREHKEITNVLLTGGDPLIMSTEKLGEVIAKVREIKHVRIIRIGTKMPAHNPIRIINDPSLLDLISRYSTDSKKIYIMSHFNHPKELTDTAVNALNLLQKAGAIIVNQTPLIRGINDDSSVLLNLFNHLSFIGVAPYYVFQCRPTLGNRPYSVPLETAFDIFGKAQSQCSGLAKRSRLVMSHSTGKIEVLGKDEEHIFMRYHEAADPENLGRFLAFRRVPDAHWFDDYPEAEQYYHRGIAKITTFCAQV
jgi:lysine 2,3-aminomutase